MNRQIRRNKKMNNKNVKLLNSKPIGEENDIKRFMIIVGIMLLVLLGLYIITDKVKNKNTDSEQVEVNYDIMSVGSLLNGSYDNYYVLIYNSNDNNASIYNSVLDEYKENSTNTNYKNIYYIDLSNKLNESYYNKDNDGKSNPNAKTLSELNLGDLTLIEIKNKKIVNYTEDFDKIIKELNINN